MIKIVVLGAGNVGKTAIVRYILEKDYEEIYQPTVYDVHQKEVICDQGSFLFEIIDMAGQYSFPAMQRLAISRSDMYILVYNVADKSSLEVARRLKDEICGLRGETSSRIPLIVIGNKMDLIGTESDCRESDFDAEVDDWCFSRLVTSAKTGYNMARFFATLIEESEVLKNLKSVKVKKTFSFETLFKRNDTTGDVAPATVNPSFSDITPASSDNYLKP